MKESEDVVRDCKAMAEEELWSGWNQVETQVRKHQGDWKKLTRGMKKRRVGVRQSFTNTDAPVGRCAF